MTQLLLCFLPIFIIFPQIGAGLLNCSTCFFDDGHMRCGEDCVADYCFQSMYYYDSESYTYGSSGCIIGHVPRLGCRANQDGQTMCVCQENYCNSNVSLIENSAVARLPAQICEKSTNDGINAVKRWEKPCAGSYCLYRNYTYDLDNTTLTSQVIDCSQSNDYDIFSSNPIFFTYPNLCIKLEYIGHASDVSCYGDAMDYSTLVFPTENLIDCFMDYYSPALPYIRTRTFCKGEMCFISSNVRGDVQRGCVSFAEGTTGEIMEPQYYRSYSGMEQWLCNTEHCNFDLIGAENSWDPSKADYKNISRLQQWNVFYIINSTPVYNLSWFFLVLPLVLLIN